MHVIRFYNVKIPLVKNTSILYNVCLLYTSDAADEL